jgi:hypothetical protein
VLEWLFDVPLAIAGPAIVAARCALALIGLAVAPIAVSVWQNCSDVGDIVSGEATRLAALYRDGSGDPEPTRSARRGRSSGADRCPRAASSA